VSTGDGGALYLLRTDGSKWADGKPMRQIARPAGIERVFSRSMTFAGGWLYCVGANAAGQRSLLRVSVGDAGTLDSIDLPASGGASPTYVADQIAVSADRTRIALAAGANSASTDIYTVPSISGTAVNVSASPAVHGLRGDALGTGLQLALSPAGTRVAYTRTAGGDELYVAPADGSGAAQHVTSNARFLPQVNKVVNPIFATEDNLVFMAGGGSLQLDVYRWDAKASAALNLSGAGSTGQPFNGQGDFAIRGGWVDDGGGWLYYVAENASTGARELRAVDLASFSVATIHGGGRVDASPRAFASCPDGSKVFFVASDDLLIVRDEVWSFDPTQGPPAVEVSGVTASVGGAWQVWDLAAAPDCSSVVFSAGGTAGLRTLWQVQLGAGSKAQPRTAVPRHFGPPLHFTADGAGVIYASGGAPDKTSLRGVALGGPVSTLDPTAGHVQVLAVY